MSVANTSSVSIEARPMSGSQSGQSKSPLNSWSPKILAIVRIMAGLLFLEHGLILLFSFPMAQPGLPHPLPPIMLVGGLIEAVGGLMIALGLFTRIAAFVTSGQMAVAYFMFHLPNSLWPAVNQGDAAILFCFVFLYLVFAGPGAWAMDRALKKSTRN